MKVSVVTITCRACGRVLSQSIPRYADVENEDPLDDEIPVVDQPVGPGFAACAPCPEHPLGPPDNGLRYSESACPFLWNVRQLSTP